MTYTALVNTLTSYERQFGTSTYSVQGQLRLKNHDAITFDNMFAGENAGVEHVGVRRRARSPRS